jgi:hypothetical protein
MCLQGHCLENFSELYLFLVGMRDRFEFFQRLSYLVIRSLCALAAHLSSASLSDFLLLYSARSASYVSHASFRCLAWHLRPSFSLFLLSLAHFWSSDSPSYSGALGDMFYSNSSEDLTSGAIGGIGGGRRIMRTSRASTTPALLELLMTSVRASASQNALPSW